MTILHENDSDSPYDAFMSTPVGTPDEVNALGHYLATLNPISATNYQKGIP